MEEEAHLYLDTNVLLHYDALDGIKWRETVSAKRVVLHIAQAVLEEISLKKDMGDTKKLRKRADALAKRLLQSLEEQNPFELRAGEYLLLEPDSPRIEEFSDLNPNSKDDQLIAAALAFRKTHPKNCYVVTGDLSLTLRVKLRRSNLDHLAVPEAHRLADEPDADERERNALQKELLELKRAQPALKLTFADGTTVMRITEDKRDVKAFIEAKMKKVRTETPHLAKPVSTHLILLKAGIGASPAEIDEYNKALDEYYARCEVWFGQALAIRRRAVDINLTVFNSGSVPAESILVNLHFPDGFKLIEAEDLSKEFPRFPKEPKRPGFDPRILQGMQDATMFYPSPLVGTQPSKDSISIRKTNSYDVEFEREKLRQNTPEPLDEMTAVFETEPFSFEVTYELRADNLRTVVQGGLHVVAPNAR